MTLITITLVIATSIAGLLWCLNKLICIQRKYKYQTSIHSSFKNDIYQNTRKKINLNTSWIETGSSFFPILATILIVRSFIYEPFRIPSGSMMPILLIGDFILVEKFTYGIKDPIYHKTLIKIGHPKRGDIVVFKYPRDPHFYYIKRIIGLPGDKIIYDPIAKEIITQPKYDSYIDCNNTLSIKYSNTKLSNFTQNFFRNKNGEIFSNFSQFSKEKNKKNSIRLIEREETIDDTTYSILILPIVQDQIDMYFHQKHQPIATWIVPPDHYFVMGDNRDNSADSRYWGFVPENNLIGKAKIIWMSQSCKWPICIRFNRVGKIY